MSEQNGHLTYDYLAKTEIPKPVEVQVKSLGKTAYIRRITAGEQERLSAMSDASTQRFAAIAIGLCKHDGSPMFDKEFMHKTDHAVNVLSKMKPEAFEEIWAEFAKINGWLAIEDLAKNSETIQA